MIVGFNLFEMYFIKWCHELFFMNSIVAGGFRANHTQTEVIVSSSFGVFLKDLWPLKEQNINPFNSQDLIVNSPL